MFLFDWQITDYKRPSDVAIAMKRFIVKHEVRSHQHADIEDIQLMDSDCHYVWTCIYRLLWIKL